jgi:hypothetical protein
VGLFLTSPRTEHAEILETIVDSRRIGCIFRALTRAGAVGHVIASGEAVALVAPERATPGTTRARHTLHWAYGGPSPSASVTVEMGGPLSLYRFSLEGAEVASGLLTTPIPTVVLRVQSRRELRVRAPAGVLLRCGAESPGGHEVHDVSWSGIAFAVEATDPFARPGAIGDAVVEWQGRLRVSGRIHVRHVSERADGKGLIAGARFSFASSEDAEHWTEEVDALALPVARSGGTWTHDLWELFETSGYFALSHKSPADFARLREAFAASSKKLGRAPHLGTQIVWPSARGVEASASVVALNRDAMFLYHLARRSGAPPAGLTGRALVYAVHARALWWIRAHEQARWLVVWVQDVARFSKRAHLDFIERNADGASASVVKTRILEVPTHPLTSEARRIPRVRGGADEDEGGTPWTTRDGQASDMPILAQGARRAFPPSFVAAHGLDTPSDRAFENWGAAGLRRGREIVIAEREGEIAAAAMLEWTEDGIHLFGLLDVVRIIPLGPAAAEAVPELLAHARHRYAQWGKSVFVFACDPDLPQEQWPEGSHDLGLSHCTVMSTELIPELAEHAWEVITGAAR